LHGLLTVQEVARQFEFNSLRQPVLDIRDSLRECSKLRVICRHLPLRLRGCWECRRFLAGRRQIGRFDRGCYKQELFEGHIQLVKAALTENKRVEFEHLVADRRRQRGPC